MCGIAGILTPAGRASAHVDELKRVSHRLRLRGPDGEGLWLDPSGRIALAHRRLSIVDPLPRSDQPMALADGETVLVLNGEIYNHVALRSELEAQGEHCLTSSDTEVVLRLYRREGRACIKRLRGMFALALWDGALGKLLLARDPFGIKPLYVAQDGRTLRFASQVKALLAGGGVGRTPDPAGLVGYHLWGHVPEPFTLLQDVRAFPAGSLAWIGADGVLTPEPFVDVRPQAELQRGDGVESESSAHELHAALEDSVRHHLVSDVPVGLFLSAGLDSSALLGLTHGLGTVPDTVTLGFAEFVGTPADETALAARVAEHYGARHRTVWVEGEAFADELDGLFDAMDQPTIDGVNAYLVSRVAAESGFRVMLSGLGGDELFGGYPSFRQLPRMVRWLRPLRAAGPALRAVSAPLLRRLTSPKYAGLLEYGGDWAGAYLLRRGLFMPWELPDVLGPELAREGWARLAPLARVSESVRDVHGSAARVRALETDWYLKNQLLRDADWASMAHSVELRTPWVDFELASRLERATRAGAERPGKRDLALVPAKPLPQELLTRKKSGFGVPVRSWLRRVAPEHARERGLRGWSRLVLERWGA